MDSASERGKINEGASAVDRGTSAILTWFRSNATTLIAGVGIIALWQIFAMFVTRSNLYFPSAWFAFTNTLANYQLVLEATRVTLTEIFAGYVLGVTIGTVGGILVSESYIIRRSAFPWVVFLYSIPHAISAPLFLVWFGINIGAIAIFVSTLCFYPVFIGTLSGFAGIEEEYYNLGHVTGASRLQMVRHIKIWVALPHMIGGYKIAIQLSIVGAIVAEFIASGSGLGYLIVTAYESLRVGLMFGVVVLLMILASVVFKVVAFAIDALKPGPDSPF